MLMEKYLTAESPAETQQVLRPPKGTEAEAQLTAPQKPRKLAHGQAAPRALATYGCYLLAQVPMNLVPASRSESSFEQVKRISS